MQPLRVPDAPVSIMSTAAFRNNLQSLVANPSAYTADDFATGIRELLSAPYQPFDAAHPPPKDADSTHDVQIAAFLASTAALRFHLQPSYLAAAARSVLSLARPVEGLPDSADADGIDIVGTGGDGKNTLNCSTASAILLAACGCRVFKHGNRASTGRTGAADVLEHLGVNLTTNHVHRDSEGDRGDDGVCSVTFLYV